MSVFESLKGVEVNRARTALLNPKTPVIREEDGDSLVASAFTDITVHPDAQYLDRVLFTDYSSIKRNLVADILMKTVASNPFGEVYIRMLEPNSTVPLEPDKWITLFEAGRISMEDIGINPADISARIQDAGLPNRNFGLPNEEPFNTFKELTRSSCACRTLVGATLLLICSNIYATL